MERRSQTFSIAEFPWDANGYKPETTVTLTLLEEELEVRFVSYESDLRAVETENNADVYCDSCVEMFAQFDPVGDSRYMNFEMNPNGAVYCAVNTPEGDSVTLPSERIDSFRAAARIHKDRWEAWLHIPMSVVKEVFPGYAHKPGTRIRGNFYKCGDKTVHPHFGCWQPITWPEPNFHRPEFFRDIIL